MLKTASLVILLLLSVNVFVLIQDRRQQQKEQANTDALLNLAQQNDNYGRYIDKLVSNAKFELTIYRNKRPSTRCSLADIVFTAARHLPDWVFPPTLWRQDPDTRHARIAHIVKQPRIYPFANEVLDRAINWTTQANDQISLYIEQTRLGLEHVYEISYDYMDFITREDDNNSALLNMVSDTLYQDLEGFLMIEKYNYTTMLNKVNEEFDHVINLSGPLRRPLESIRFDIMHQLKETKNQSLDHIVAALNQLLKHSQGGGGGELNNVSSNDLKKYIIKRIRGDLASFYKTSTILDHLKQKMSWILFQASKEFKQGPTQLTYWMDILNEMKDVDLKLMKDLPKKFPVVANTKNQNCC